MTPHLYNHLNFSWLINNELAGSKGPMTVEHLQFLKNNGIKALVRMSDYPKIDPDSIRKEGLIDCHQPVEDMLAPSIAQITYMLDFIESCLNENKPVGVSCDGGIGRTATLLSCFLVSKGASVEDAITQVKNKRPGSILSVEQQKAIEDYAKHIKYASEY